MIVIDKYDFYFGSSSSDSSEEEESEAIPISQRTSATSLASTASEKSGWLQKQSDNIIKSWSWRFFVLRDSKLFYYSKPTDQTPSGILNFNQVSAKLKVSNPSCPTQISISVSGLTYSLNLKSKSPSNLLDWALHIQKHIDSSAGKVKELPLVTFGEKLWKHERVSEYFFRTSASTGDLILFRSKDLASRIQRGITGSKYDHIALVLCYLSGKVCLLEATYSNGVSLLLWNEFKENQWNLLTERIVYRKLELGCVRVLGC